MAVPPKSRSLAPVSPMSQSRAGGGLLRLQLAVFALVTASFTNIYLPQPVLPIIQDEFAVGPAQASMTVSFVILGIVLSNLLFGYLSDRYPIRPIIAAGGTMVALGGVTAALTRDFNILVGARLVQGLFIPALTTSLAAWLARTLPVRRLSTVMGAYVSATIMGGLGGRLLGGWIHPPLHWRYAFFSAAAFIAATTILAVLLLPRTSRSTAAPQTETKNDGHGYLSLLKRKELLLIYGCGAGSLLIFSPVFNYLPYRLAAPPFGFSTELITMVYLVYVLGIFLGPVAGQLSARFGGGAMLIAGSVLLGGSLGLLLLPSVTAVLLGLLGVCGGFFTVHAVAVVLLNRKLSADHGRANALYVLFYYTGGWIGINGAGLSFEYLGWPGVVGFVGCFLVIPLAAGILERRSGN